MARNKVLFINPPQTYDKKARHSNLKFPLGFLYMAGYLESYGFKVKIIDCPLYYKKRRKISESQVKLGLFPEDIKKIILEFNPDITGISCAYSAYESDSFEIADLIKNINKNILVIAGGAHTSANPSSVLKNKNIDIAVLGEGEESTLEIARKYRDGRKLDGIRGTALMKKGKIKINKPREFVKNLDKLKSAWHLIDMNLYFNHPENSNVTLRSPAVDIITSRGCPGNCVFCSIHTVWGRKWRGRTAKNVVDEIQYLMEKYNVRQLRIQDDNLTLDRKRILDICNEIIRRKLDIRWDTPNGVAIWTLDEEVLTKMKQAGCYRITFGIESGCKKTQEYVRKIIDEKKINYLIDICHKIGMWVCSTFIIGFPYENNEDLRKTIDFILNSRINFPFIYVAQPYPGTDMYEDFKKEKLLENIRATSNLGSSRYNTKYFSNDFLNKKRSNLFKKFYLKKALSYTNPIVFYKEFLSKIRNSEDVRYILKNLKAVISGI